MPVDICRQVDIYTGRCLYLLAYGFSIFFVQFITLAGTIAIMTDDRIVLVSWAQATPNVRRVWLFGSRVKGTHRPDSDLDVAVEIDAVGNDETPFDTWVGEAAGWKSQLQLRITAALDLQWFDPDGSTPKIQAALGDAASLIYERAS